MFILYVIADAEKIFEVKGKLQRFNFTVIKAIKVIKKFCNCTFHKVQFFIKNFFDKG